MKYRIVPVDTRQPEVVQLLSLLQKACLPTIKFTQSHKDAGMLLTHRTVRLLGSLVLFPLVVGLTLCIFVGQVLYALIVDAGFRRGLLKRGFAKPKR